MQARSIVFGAASPFLFAGMAAAQTTPATTQQLAQPAPTAQPTPPAEPPSTDSDQPTAPQADTQAGQIVPATAADLKVGATVLGIDGSTVGTIESVAPEGVVIATGKVRVQVPSASVGKNERGLIVATTRAQLEEKAANPAPGP